MLKSSIKSNELLFESIVANMHIKVNVLVKLKHYAFTAFGEKVPVQLTPLLMPILKIAHVI